MRAKDTSRDDHAIRTIYESWFSAMEKGDVPRLLALLTPDAVLKMPASPAIVGIQAIERALRGFHDAFSETVEYRVEEVEASGDMAFALVSERSTVRSKSGGDESTVEGIHLAVLRRQPDGGWLVARDVSSLSSSY